LPALPAAFAAFALPFAGAGAASTGFFFDFALCLAIRVLLEGRQELSCADAPD
jgi:hypothetical protein